jgi:subtilisin family serine protease
VKYVSFGNLTVNERMRPTPGALYGHPNAAGATAVGAARYSHTPAFGVDPPLVEYFSSAGGTPILRDTSGAAIVELRQKPEIVAPDGGDNTFFGSDYEGNGWPNFFGTSAAAPHAAGVAALMKSFDGNLTPAQILAAMQASAIDMDTAGVDFNTGSGLIQADQALASLIDPLAVTTGSLPAGRVSVYYLQSLAAEGGFGSYSWSILDGDLPPGVTLESTGVLSGTPTENLSSPYIFTARVIDTLNNSSTRVFSIDVASQRTCGSCH